MHFAVALNGKEGTCFTVQARRHLVCAWNKRMEAKHWSKEGRQTFHVADTLLQRHGGAFVSLSRIITYIYDVVLLMNDHAGGCACLVYVFLPNRTCGVRL